MKFKFGYVIIISCIFLISGGTCNSYAYNVETSPKSYHFGVPDYAEGIDQDMEITEYDKDEWRDHIGYVSEPDEIFGGTKYDADVEGAKLRSEILDWKRKKDSLPFFSDFVLTADLEVEDIPEAENLNDVFDYITTSINDLTADPLVPTSEKPILSTIALVNNTWGGNTGITNWVAKNATIANDTAAYYNFDSTYVNAIYPKNIDGYNLHRDLWWWTTKEFKKYPDVSRFDVPFIKDPEDWVNTYDILAALKADVLAEVSELTNAIENVINAFDDLKILDPANWTYINGTLAGLLKMFKGIEVPLDQGGDDYPKTFLMAALDPTGNNYLQEGQKGLYAIFDQLGNQIPGKFGFLWQLLLQGLPVLTPIDDYLEDVVDDFDIDGKTVETGILGLDPATRIIGDVWTDENTIILEFEYADPNEERDGWKVEFTYDEYGIQEHVVFLGSEPFYEQELLPSSLEQRIVSAIVTTSVIMGVIGIVLISYLVIYKLKKRK